MNNNTLAVSISILGKDYKIACGPEDRDELINSAHQLDTQMRKIRDSGRVSGPDRIAVMAALNLAHELAQMKQQNILLTQKLNESLAAMSHKIENVLENSQTR